MILRVECSSGALEPMYLAVRDESGRRLWTLRQRSTGGIFRFTKFRSLFPLTMDMTGPGGDYVLHRPAGIVRRSYELRRPAGEIVYRMVTGWRRWVLRDRHEDELAEVRFSNPLVLGKDRGVLDARGGTPVIEYQFVPVGFLSGRWEGELRFLAPRESWEVPGVALAAVRLAHKQQR